MQQHQGAAVCPKGYLGMEEVSVLKTSWKLHELLLQAETSKEDGHFQIGVLK